MLNLTARIERMEIGRGRRILVTSDIHGYLPYLKGVLEKASFGDGDILFIVGDMIEKGPENLATLRYVMKLCEQGNVVPLIGNVDAYRLKLICGLSESNAADLCDYILSLRKWVGTSFYEELAAECGYKINTPEDVLAAKADIIEHFDREFKFLSGLPTVVETENYVFVHGGLLEKEVSDNEGKGIFELTKYDGFMEKTPHVFDKYVVVGHWPVPLYSRSLQKLNPIINREKRIISLDGGCGVKNECQLNLLVIPDIDCDESEITYMSYDALPSVKALDSQSASDDPIHISWINREIRVIDKGEEFSHIEHRESGRRLCVPNSYLRNDTECSDYTDYILPVKAGDELSLIKRTSKGCIAKKDGVVGWYLGRLEGDFAEGI